MRGRFHDLSPTATLWEIDREIGKIIHQLEIYSKKEESYFVIFIANCWISIDTT